MRHSIRNAFLAASLPVLALLASNAHAACKTCGSVVEVKTVEQKGEASGAGAVIGGIAGGVLGHQIGSGRGNTAATVAGAAGGAYAGHQIEKNKNAKTTYKVVVRMEDGASRTFDYASPTAFRAGDKVKIVDGKLVRQ
ncbi:MAG TPA: glycine zipper 2TM domain-containing protein [Usitatibacter sp.]|nr:glycine zipper 2TM domain-containing protein [Usitatibacter sp.]